jgi:prophage tail gpP-like protein
MSYQSGSGFIIQGEAQDSEIKRNRTLCIQAEGKADKTVLKQRAQWEMEVRRAKSHKVTGIVQGFRSSSGKIWEIGDSVKFESEFLALHHSFLITSVHFQFGEQGKRTTLELESSQAVQLDPTLKSTQNPYLKLLKGGL